MTILVTGAAGFLGTAVVERLLAHGHRNIRCFIRARSRRDRLQEVISRYPDSHVEIFFGGLSSREEIARALDGAHTVIHLAAAMSGAAADMVLNTVVASRTLLEAIGDRKPMRVVLVSSFSVYGVANLGRGAAVTEETPLEPHPELRDPYTYSKLRQEQLFREHREQKGFELVVLRPGVIYGPGGGHFSVRVGFSVFGLFLHLGHGNALPLTFVENCAEAVVVAGLRQDSAGRVFNVVDDDLPTCRQYLHGYKSRVRKIRSIPIPYFSARVLSRLIENYHRRSKGQLPAVLTPYVTATIWAGNHFDNQQLKSVGWRPIVSTRAALDRTFDAFRSAVPKA